MFRCIYIFSKKKLKILQKYLEKNLEKGLLRNFNYQQDILVFLYIKKIKHFAKM